MALTNGEATDINTVLQYLLHIPDALGHVPEDDNAKAAAERLAEKAHQKLWAGITQKDVSKAWR